MTTIACNRKMMASDSKVTWDSNVGYRSQKIFKVGESIFGLRGDNWSNVFIDWARRGFLNELRPDFIGDDTFAETDFDVLEIAHDGIYIWDKYLSRIPVLEDNYAIGSGAKVALYCMRVQKIPPDAAVLEASKIDEYTDRHIQKAELD